MIDTVPNGKWHLRVGTINTAGGRIDQVSHLLAAAGFKQVQKTDHVTVNVSPWILQRVPHAGLGSQVDHLLKTMLLEKRLQRLFLQEVELLELESRRAIKLCKPILFQLGIVVIVEVIDSDNLHTVLE